MPAAGLTYIEVNLLQHPGPAAVLLDPPAQGPGVGAGELVIGGGQAGRGDLGRKLGLEKMLGKCKFELSTVSLNWTGVLSLSRARSLLRFRGEL